MAEHDKFDLAEAAGEKYIFPTEENVSHDIFMEECRKSGFTPQIITYTNRPGRRIELVKAGLGISMISRSGLSFYNNSGEGAVVKELARPFYKEIVVARRRKEYYSFMEKALWDFIENKMK